MIRTGPAATPLSWVLATVIMIGVLSWPALWNGFPIVFYDTGGYLARPFEHTLALGRSTAYGVFLALGIPFHFWINVAVQAALVVWLVALTFRNHGFGGRPILTMAVVISIAALTGLPWYVGQLMPDIFVAVAVLGIYLLAFGDHAMAGELPGSSTGLQTWEKILLVAIIAFAEAGHMATLALATGLLVVLLVLRSIAVRIEIPRPALLMPAISIATGVLLLLASNFAIASRLAFTPGGENFAFAHLVNDGIVARYLADQCPDPSLRLCSYRDQIPEDGNDWMWDGNSPLNRDLGGTEAFAPEAARIVHDCLRLYPGTVISSAIKDALYQFVLIRTWDGIVSDAWTTIYVIQTLAPQANPAFAASRQQRDRLYAEDLTVHHPPIALAAMLTLPVIVALGLRSKTRRSTSMFALFVLLALLGNAAICGAFSVPAWRYQSRLAPLAPFAVMLAALDLLVRRSPATSRSRPYNKPGLSSA
jgi:hypothetical protein